MSKLQSVRTLNALSHRSCRPAAVFTQSSIAWAIDSITNPQLNDDPGTIIAFPGEIFGLVGRSVPSSTVSDGCYTSLDNIEKRKHLD
jgi:hypothetical protein